ncbi:CBS domain-containing protein [Clostridium sp. MB40-C1]|uniref:CBS domain-containing protein n=1 Tax=Clostridium sp. MB40-C1 TaxID=3070996 RepID=UPI0027E1E50E|nr:CBS domain-containing protein [Clostridium sp. MB40-C1]WMJ79516.1 CBS domain-containing protein [Clostridium sp. MB40-C1]
MKLVDIMNTNVIHIGYKDTIRTALSIMTSNKINGAPVVDENKTLLGIIVKADIYRFLNYEGHYDTYPVENIMNKEVVTCSENDTIIDVAKRVRENDVIALPVVDEDFKVKGIVSIEDLLDYFIKNNE